jgi:hypothetical protein
MTDPKPGVSEKPTAPQEETPRDRHGHRIEPCLDCGKIPCVCPPDCTGPDCAYGLLAKAAATPADVPEVMSKSRMKRLAIQRGGSEPPAGPESDDES